ncbi:hypothetical protein M440DRAFT_1405412 [Trichoderma longibrachiatum ATCC 18648]|uniref:Uncharacterized protein n=1 Tax=Trichoderma longibrachiatum ATCC 18648 TaxID=983965 RepID=A0A2T4BSX4_TRILO|nr:hypothetical protein M440DRAFT_1405412 [Trichoderma longibrachiatum ATCC 18648]
MQSALLARSMLSVTWLAVESAGDYALNLLRLGLSNASKCKFRIDHLDKHINSSSEMTELMWPSLGMQGLG